VKGPIHVHNSAKMSLSRRGGGNRYPYRDRPRYRRISSAEQADSGMCKVLHIMSKEMVHACTVILTSSLKINRLRVLQFGM
jgi:hypothetical protein